MSALSVPNRHRLELNLGAGPAIPTDWYHTSRNQSIGLNIQVAALAHVGAGFAVGIGGEWSRLPWTPNAGASAHVDSWVLGPELRYTERRLGRLAPLVYLGLGWGGINQSPQSSCAEVFGGPAARGGLGVDVGLNDRWSLGVSVGLVVQPPAVTSRVCIVSGSAEEPGTPEAPGNVWAIRIVGRGNVL